MTARTARPKPDDDRLTFREVRDLMKRSYTRPLEPVPALHQMARRRRDLPVAGDQDDDTTTTPEGNGS
ncbi:MAG: hypothetical protein ACRDOK_27335 [Streptosporangiaceae bacterium]